MKLLLVTLTLFIFNVSAFAKVYLIKQWHMVHNVDTQNFVKVKKIPQYNHIKALFMIMDEWVRTKKIDVVIAEGCQGEINENFKLTFNGWNYRIVNSLVNTSHFDDVITHIPLKLEVKHKNNLKTFCGDNLKLIKQNLFEFSEINGSISFLTRLTQNKNNPKKFRSYHKELEQVTKKKIKDPISFAKKKALTHLKSFEKLINMRNNYFVKAIKRFKGKNIAVVIGGEHIADLKKKLKEQNITFEIFTPPLYPPNNQLVKQLKKLIESL